jgi:predicted AAA+ superfamily ATPase
VAINPGKGMPMYLHRHIEGALLRRAAQKGAVVLTGSRQVGKTTLIENLVPQATKVTLDNTFLKESAISEPNSFLELYQTPLFIDEVQYAPQLFPYIKMALDTSKRKGEYFLTGSQNFALMRDVSESLAGRAGILELYGLSLREIFEEEPSEPFIPNSEHIKSRIPCKHAVNAQKLWQIIHRGSLPELVLNSGYDWEDYYSDYVKTYIERDIRSLAQVASESDFLRFMTVCAAMTGQMLNLASLARDVGISQPTAKRWLSLLRTSNLIYLLRPYSNNAINRAVKTPKLHFLDSGLAAYLTRWLTAETLRAGAMKGHFFESFVLAEIIKSYANNGKEADLYFLRDGNGNEIDLLIHRDNTLYPIEIKAGSEPSVADTRAFSLLKRIPGITIGEGAVICMAKEILPLTKDVYVLPLWAI